MLTESSEAISSHKSLQILAIASLSLPQFDANPFYGGSGKVPDLPGRSRFRSDVIGTELQIFDLTRFLDANRFPLRWKTL
jgi:hypothetical protein